MFVRKSCNIKGNEKIYVYEDDENKSGLQFRYCMEKWAKNCRFLIAYDKVDCPYVLEFTFSLNRMLLRTNSTLLELDEIEKYIKQLQYIESIVPEIKKIMEEIRHENGE